MPLLRPHCKAFVFAPHAMKKLLPCLLILLGAALYGTMSSCVKLANSHGFPAAELAFWQAAGAAAVLWAGALGTQKLPTLREASGVLVTGAAIGLTNLLYYESLAFITASLAVVVLMQFTWMTLFFDFVFWRRRPTRAEVLAAAGVLLGSILASSVLEQSFSPSLKGLALALACAVTYALYICLGSRTGASVPWLPRSALIMTGSAAVIALFPPAALVSEHLGNPAFAGWIAILALAGCALPTALFAVGMPKAGPAASAVLMTMELPVAVLTAHGVLGEAVSLLQAAGVAVMLAAIGMLNRARAATQLSS